MKKHLCLLGATGSIGTQTLSLLDNGKNIVLEAFSCGSNVAEALKILKRFSSVRQIAVFDPDAAAEISGRCPDIRLFSGPDANEKLLLSLPADTWVLNAISGTAGIAPSFTALGRSMPLLLANKETLVVGGELFKRERARSASPVYPLDSEHSALVKLLRKSRRSDIESLIITASGGSLRDRPLSDLDRVTPEEVLVHPTWRMGAKITVDSATMANKAFETVEASVLFGFPLEQIRVLVHDQSLIHAGLLLKDGSWTLECAPNDMRMPIAYALAGQRRVLIPNLAALELDQMKSLDFRPLEAERYPLFGFIQKAARQGGTAMAVVNAADEEAIAAFLSGRIRFTDIARVVEKTYRRVRLDTLDSLEDIVYALQVARSEAKLVLDESFGTY